MSKWICIAEEEMYHR